jgi:hypothetical protein
MLVVVKVLTKCLNTSAGLNEVMSYSVSFTPDDGVLLAII